MSYTTLSPAARLEISKLQAEAESILNNKNMTRAEGKKVDVILAKIATLKDSGVTDVQAYRSHINAVAASLGFPQTDWETETRKNPAQAAHEHIFRMFLAGRADVDIQQQLEKRATDFIAGAQTISFTAGAAGGVLVPIEFQKSVTEGLAQVDPLLDPNVSTVIQEPDYSLRPRVIPGWDLSSIAATKVGETSQHTSDAIPGVSANLLNGHTYRLSLGASFEWFEDTAPAIDAMGAMGRAFGIGFARGIGADLINGNGSTAPAGVLNGLSSAYTTAAAGVVAYTDITAIYFKLNRIYRSSPKCGWLMNDAAYQLVRNAKDGNGRALIDIVDDEERLMGKPVYIAPSLPTSGTGSFCVFGDLSHFHVHASTMFLRRRLQTPGYVENGKALYTGLLRVDSALSDPTNGAMPPVVAATLHP